MHTRRNCFYCVFERIGLVLSTGHQMAQGIELSGASSFEAVLIWLQVIFIWSMNPWNLAWLRIFLTPSAIICQSKSRRAQFFLQPRHRECNGSEYRYAWSLSGRLSYGPVSQDMRCRTTISIEEASRWASHAEGEKMSQSPAAYIEVALPRDQCSLVTTDGARG